MTSPAPEDPAHASEDPSRFYRQRLREIGEDAGRLSATRRRLQWAGLLSIGAVVGLGLLADRAAAPWWAEASPALALLAIVLGYNGVRRRLHAALRLETHYRRAIWRATGEAIQSGHGGEEYRHAEQLYDPDLDVLGPNSLFGLLATVRTGVAQERLADWLLREAAPLVEIAGRQAAVRELAPAWGMRERVVLLGERDGLLLPAGALNGWREAPTVALPRWVQFALLATSSAMLLLLLAGLAGWLPWGMAETNLLAVLAVQAAISMRVRRPVLLVLGSAKGIGRHLGVLREGCALLAEETGFASPELVRLREAARGSGTGRGSVTGRDSGSVRGSGSVRALRRLEDLARFVDGRANGAVFIPSLLLALGTHTAYALLRWRRRHAAELDRWLSAWAEFEVLLALATYASEHPRNCFPELVEGDAAVFVASDLRHPLLPSAAAVGNDIDLGEETHCYLISGSNMAGKSTLLRTIGTNAVLAFTGAPIPAARARLSRLEVAASIGTGDSLAEGRSRFLAEVDRLRATVAKAESGGAPVLFLVDEVLGGTNSTDRRLAAGRILHTLVRRGAIGALSTHDLALTELGDAAELRAVNLHMGSDSTDDPLGFDFRLKPGVNRTSSAEAILRLMGL